MFSLKASTACQVSCPDCVQLTMKAVRFSLAAGHELSGYLDAFKRWCVKTWGDHSLPSAQAGGVKGGPAEILLMARHANFTDCTFQPSCHASVMISPGGQSNIIWHSSQAEAGCRLDVRWMNPLEIERFRQVEHWAGSQQRQGVFALHCEASVLIDRKAASERQCTPAGEPTPWHRLRSLQEEPKQMPPPGFALREDHGLASSGTAKEHQVCIGNGSARIR